MKFREGPMKPRGGPMKFREGQMKFIGGTMKSLVVPRLNFCLRLQCLGSFPVFVFVNPWTGLSSLIKTNKSQPRSGWRHKPKKFKISESNSPEWQ